MARRQRDLTRSTWFHVNNRGVDRQDIYSDDHDHALFERLLGDAAARSDVEVHSYVLMSNHFHLLVHCPDGGLSDMMQWLCSRYGSAYNAHAERTGPVLGGRFYSVPVTDDAQLAQTARYIHRNPLAFVPQRALAAYRWSSLGAILGRRPSPGWLADGVVRPAGMTADRYLDYVVTSQPSDLVAESRDGCRSVGVTAVDDAVAAVFRCDSASIHSVVPGRPSPERDLAVTLAMELRAATVAELADHYGLADQSSVRRIGRRGRVRSATDPAFSRYRLRVLDRLMSATLPFGVGSEKAGLE